MSNNPEIDYLVCPNCSASFRWKPEYAGKTATCKKCSMKLKLPKSADGPIQIVRTERKSAQPLDSEALDCERPLSAGQASDVSSHPYTTGVEDDYFDFEDLSLDEVELGSGESNDRPLPPKRKRPKKKRKKKQAQPKKQRRGRPKGVAFVIEFMRSHLKLTVLIVAFVIWYFGTFSARRFASSIEEDFHALGHSKASVSTPWLSFGTPGELTVTITITVQDRRGNIEDQYRVSGDYSVSTGEFEATEKDGKILQIYSFVVTPLMAAAKTGQTERVETILRSGDPASLEHLGKALSLAKANDHTECAEKILRFRETTIGRKD